MELIDGRAMARGLMTEIQGDIAKLGFRPQFCDVLVGSDSVSEQYVRMKERRARDIGLGVHTADFPESITTDELVAEIKKINHMENMCGLIVQLPLPEHLDTQTVLDAIDPSIDVDVLTTQNEQAFYMGEPMFVYPTAAAVIYMLDQLEIDLTDKKFAVIGQGRLVGKPVTHLLQSRGYQVAAVDKETEHPDAVTRDADIIVSAVGKDNLITGDKIKQNAVIIDAGTSEEDGNVVGDVDMLSVQNIASHVSPVPGGVGPLTVALLFKNVLLAAKAKITQK